MRLGNLQNNSLYPNEDDCKKFEAFLKEKEIERISNTSEVQNARRGYHIYDIPREVNTSNEETFNLLCEYFMSNPPSGNWSLSW